MPIAPLRGSLWSCEAVFLYTIFSKNQRCKKFKKKKTLQSPQKLSEVL